MSHAKSEGLIHFWCRGRGRLSLIGMRPSRAPAMAIGLAADAAALLSERANGAEMSAFCGSNMASACSVRLADLWQHDGI